MAILPRRMPYDGARQYRAPRAFGHFLNLGHTRVKEAGHRTRGCSKHGPEVVDIGLMRKSCEARDGRLSPTVLSLLKSPTGHGNGLPTKRVASQPSSYRVSSTRRLGRTVRAARSSAICTALSA